MHVQDIAHVSNYDLPEVAEHFIHRVGRTGRAGEHGVATTLFTRKQRSELFQLERTLATRMERLALSGALPERKDRPRQVLYSLPSAQRSQLPRIPSRRLQ